MNPTLSDWFEVIKNCSIENTYNYTRYHVFHSNWKEFMLGKHSLTNVIEWSKKMGDKRYDW